MQQAIIEEKERKVFWNYLVPSMLSMLAVSAYSFVDTFVVGQAMGAQAVAAMGVGTPVVSILFALGFLCGSGGAVNYSIQMGLGQREKANAIFSCAFFAALFLWLVIGVAGNLWISPLASFLGATAGNLALAVEYLRWILSLSGFLIMDLVMNSFMRNEGHPTVSMVATVTGTVINIGLDFLFVMGFHWGMGGAAAATCLASVISVCINTGYAYAKKTNLIARLRRGLLRNLPSILKIGFGSFVLEGAVALISTVFLNFSGKYYGDDGVSAFSVLITLNLVVYSLINGVAQSIQPLISANYGCGKELRIRKFLRYGLITALLLGGFFFALAELMPEALVKLFVADSESITALASAGLQSYAASFLFMAVSIVIGIYFQSKTKPVPSFVILLGRSAAFPILLVYVLSAFLADWSVWIAVPTGEGIAAVLALLLLKSEKKETE